MRGWPGHHVAALGGGRGVGRCAAVLAAVATRASPSGGCGSRPHPPNIPLAAGSSGRFGEKEEHEHPCNTPVLILTLILCLIAN